MALSTSRTVVTNTGLSTHHHFRVRDLISVGVATFSNFKTGSTNVHSVGVEAAGINVLGGDTPIGSGATIYDDGGARFSGVVTATSFHGSVLGDISQATGAAAGLGTALSQTQTDPLNKVYYTDKVLSISTTTTIDHPATANLAYTQYGDIKIEDGHDLIIKADDDFKYDILGISTTKIPNNQFPSGLSGDLTGNVTGTASTSTNAATAYAIDSTASLNTSGIITATTFVGSAGTISAYGPAFKAYRSSSLSISHNSNTTVVFDTKVFDTNNCYNALNGVFTPNVAGYYHVHFSMRIDLVSADHLFQARINSGSSGVNYIGIDQRFNKSSNANNSASVSILHAFNGSSDSVFAQAYQNSGYTNTILGNSHETWFEAYFIRPL